VKRVVTTVTRLTNRKFDESILNIVLPRRAAFLGNAQGITDRTTS
jgi:hypothetical protein